MISTLKRNMILAAVVASASVSAQAREYLFTDQYPPSSDWNHEDNWSPSGGPPSGGDWATIPDGLTCEIALADQSIATLTIDDGGRLEVTGRTLTITFGAEDYGITVNGEVKFFGDASIETTSAGMHILGGGTISCTGSGNLLTIRSPGSEYSIVHVGRDTMTAQPTIKGNVTILAHIRNCGLLLVDTSGDVMTIGHLSTSVPHVYLQGPSDGGFEVTGGHMKFGRCRPVPSTSLTFECKWRVNGGKMELTEYAEDGYWWGLAKHSIHVYSGTLEFRTSMATTGGISFYGGQIRLVHPSAVSFTHPSE